MKFLSLFLKTKLITVNDLERYKKIMLETDSPYLSPEPKRGKVNEPSHIIHTLKHISKIKNETEENIALATSNNFFKLFNIKIAA